MATEVSEAEWLWHHGSPMDMELDIASEHQLPVDQLIGCPGLSAIVNTQHTATELAAA